MLSTSGQQKRCIRSTAADMMLQATWAYQYRFGFHPDGAEAGASIGPGAGAACAGPYSASSISYIITSDPKMHLRPPCCSVLIAGAC